MTCSVDSDLLRDVYRAVRCPCRSLVSVDVSRFCDLCAPRGRCDDVPLPQYFISGFNPSLTRWPVPPRMIVVGVMVLIFGLANNDPYKLRLSEHGELLPWWRAWSRRPPPGREWAIRERSEASRRRQRRHRPPVGTSLVDDAEALKSWLAAVKTDAKAPATATKPKLVIVAISGGAALGVLVGRRARPPGSADPWIRLARADHHRCVGRNGRGRLLCQAQAGQSGRAPTRSVSPLSSLIPVNSITPVAAHLALRDVWQALLPRLRQCGQGHRSRTRLERHRFPDPATEGK